MPSKFFQPFSNHLTIRLLHRRRDRHWAPLDPNQPHQSCICYLNGFLNAYKKNQPKMGKSFCWTCSAPGAPSRAQGWVQSWNVHTVCTWPGHLPGTHLQLPWLGNHSFPLAPGDWSCETKGKGGSAAIWAPSTPAAVQSEKHRLCCLKHCPVLRQR